MKRACVLVFATLVFAALAVAPRPSAGDSGAADNTPTAGSDAGTPGADPSLVHAGTGGTAVPTPPAPKAAEAASAPASPKITKSEQGCCGGAAYDNKKTTVQ